MEAKTRNTLIWFALNIALAAAFLAVASMWWVPSELADIPGAAWPYALGWGFIALPIVVGSLVLNLVVLAWAAHRRRSRGALPIWRVGWMLVLLWVCVLIMDGSRHGS